MELFEKRKILEKMSALMIRNRGLGRTPVTSSPTGPTGKFSRIEEELLTSQQIKKFKENTSFSVINQNGNFVEDTSSFAARVAGKISRNISRLCKIRNFPEIARSPKQGIDRLGISIVLSSIVAILVIAVV